MNRSLEVEWLGRIPYETGLGIQDVIVGEKAEQPDKADRLFLLEHEPVYTIGRSPDQTSLREISMLPYPVVQTNRGGKATYHGPGQLVGYPVLDLRKRGQDLHQHLRLLEQGLVELCTQVGVNASVRDGLTGVWVGSRKIASIGVGVRRWISMHGFALNVGGPLDGFSYITPCGLDGVEITSLEKEGAQPMSVREVADLAGTIFARLLATDYVSS